MLTKEERKQGTLSHIYLYISNPTFIENCNNYKQKNNKINKVVNHYKPLWQYEIININLQNIQNRSCYDTISTEKKK